MTMEEANARALAASMSGEIKALTCALADRAEALNELLQSEPSEQLAVRIRNAIAAGEFIERDLHALKGRITQVRSVLLTRSAADPVIDCLG
jgi:hypothetical protein